jgi:regulator of protease activity HflC (stomatin/prohibitin superfamily)
MRDWGQFIVLLAALGGFYGFIRSDMSAMERRLGARIDRNAELIFANGEALSRNAEAISRNAEAISRNAEGIARSAEAISRVREDLAHLEGYIRGRLGGDPG